MDKEGFAKCHDGTAQVFFSRESFGVTQPPYDAVIFQALRLAQAPARLVVSLLSENCGELNPSPQDSQTHPCKNFRLQTIFGR